MHRPAAPGEVWSRKAIAREIPGDRRELGGENDDGEHSQYAESDGSTEVGEFKHRGAPCSNTLSVEDCHSAKSAERWQWATKNDFSGRPSGPERLSHSDHEVRISC